MITLYIATHNETGLKYFGKSSTYHTEEKLQKHYHGSGIRWMRHLKKHGWDDVKMTLYFQSEDIELVQLVAEEFSDLYDVVDSTEWANLILENGIDGIPKGTKYDEKTLEKMRERSHSEKSRKLISDRTKGVPKSKEWIQGRLDNFNHSEETKRRMSEAHKGKKFSEESKIKMRKGRKTYRIETKDISFVGGLREFTEKYPIIEYHKLSNLNISFEKNPNYKSIKYGFIIKIEKID